MERLMYSIFRGYTQILNFTPNRYKMEQPKLKNIKIALIPKYDAIAENPNGEKIILNSNDVALLIFCSQQERWISEIAKYLDIAVKNVSVRLSRLESFGLISINDYEGGKRRYIKTLIEIPEELKLGETHREI